MHFNKVMFCSSDIIKQYKPIEIPNKAVANDEYFYDVPITCWEIHDI